MKIRNVIRMTAAAALAVLFSACASVNEQSADDRIVVVSGDTVDAYAANNYNAINKMNLQPGKFYIEQTFSEVFEIEKVDTSINEEGLLSVRVYGRTAPYSFWKWLGKGEEPYRIAFRFIWFDKDGKLLDVPYSKVPRTRECLPGDRIRFSALASDEKCRQFSLALAQIREVQEEKVQQDLKKVGADMEQAHPTEEEPLKEVKIVK